MFVVRYYNKPGGIMATEYKTISLGSNEEGSKRLAAYREAAQKSGKSLAAFIRGIIDAAIGFTYKKEQ